MVKIDQRVSESEEDSLEATGHKSDDCSPLNLSKIPESEIVSYKKVENYK